jgi:phytoene/squalene synthetase
MSSRLIDDLVRKEAHQRHIDRVNSIDGALDNTLHRNTQLLWERRLNSFKSEQDRKKKGLMVANRELHERLAAMKPVINLKQYQAPPIITTRSSNARRKI